MHKNACERDDKHSPRPSSHWGVRAQHGRLRRQPSTPDMRAARAANSEPRPTTKGNDINAQNHTAETTGTSRSSHHRRKRAGATAGACTSDSPVRPTRQWHEPPTSSESRPDPEDNDITAQNGSERSWRATRRRARARAQRMPTPTWQIHRGRGADTHRYTCIWLESRYTPDTQPDTQ